MKSYFVLLIIAVLAVALMAACGTKTETQLIEVTRLVQEPVIQVETVVVVAERLASDGTQPVEVTRLVEVTRVVEVEKEVTRVVTATPEPSEYEQAYQFSGKGNGTTEAFTFKPGSWRIYWECAAPAPNGFSVYLSAPETTYGAYVARILGSGKGYTTMLTTANTDTSMQFVFTVKADYDWTITLEYKP
jgi:hypothetical protein